MRGALFGNWVLEVGVGWGAPLLYKSMHFAKKKERSIKGFVFTSLLEESG